MPKNSLEELFIDELRDLYSAEEQITRALPKLAKKASSPQLQAAFEEHLEQTREHISRLEQIFKDLGESPEGKTCRGMAGLLKEGDEMMSEEYEPETMDAALISAAQRVEHYEMAGYGTVRTWAKLLDNSSAAKLLQKTLDEEGDTDKKLTKLAESKINKQAEKAAA